jgi:hypothetical protein
MTIPETRYQKYLARKRQKQQERKTTLAPLRAATTWQMRWVAHAPIHECLVPAILFERGIGNLLFSRSLPDGRIALAAFLLDVFCLGVKDAFFTLTTTPQYAERLRGWSASEKLEPMHPSCFRKLVEGGVAYAGELGFNPHADYVRARQIFGDVETAACPAHFEYGHEGKPFYISGPHESATQVRATLDQLQRRFGSDNFHYLVLAG